MKQYSWVMPNVLFTHTSCQPGFYSDLVHAVLAWGQGKALPPFEIHSSLTVYEHTRYQWKSHLPSLCISVTITYIILLVLLSHSLNI